LVAEFDSLNTIYKKNPSMTSMFMNEMWGLKFFESSCGTVLDIKNIPQSDDTDGRVGRYAKILANSQKFGVQLDPDLWALIRNRENKNNPGELPLDVEINGRISNYADTLNYKFKVAYSSGPVYLDNEVCPGEKDPKKLK
jgi:hypothetical protein